VLADSIEKIPTAMKLLLAFAAALSTANAMVEWAGVFPVNDSTHTWSMQQVDGAYADPAMKIVLFSADAADAAAIESNEDTAAALIEGECEDVAAGGTAEGPVTSDGVCYNLVVDEASEDSTFTINTEGVTSLLVYAEHNPMEFERDMHYLQDSAGADVEPAAQESAAGHDHDHNHDHGDEEVERLDSTGISCACEAASRSFAMDCDDKSAMLAALNFLSTNSCSKPENCGRDTECEKNYLIVQSHHDYCPEANIPEEVEDGFHDYDSSCRPCDIVRKYMEGSPDCPPSNCSDDSGNGAYESMVTEGCEVDCTSDKCRDLYFTLRVVHDDCAHNTLSKSAEEGLHDMEKTCEMYTCNAIGAKEQEPVTTCDNPPKSEDEKEGEAPKEDAPTEGEQKSGAARVSFTAAALVAGLAMA